MPEVNVVFEGGGVKGVALVGALARTVSEDITVRGYAGSSAGAIVAAFASVGYGTGELRDILYDTNYTNFLDGRDEFPLAALKEIVSAFNVFARTGGIDE